MVLSDAVRFGTWEYVLEIFTWFWRGVWSKNHVWRVKAKILKILATWFVYGLWTGPLWYLVGIFHKFYILYCVY